MVSIILRILSVGFILLGLFLGIFSIVPPVWQSQHMVLPDQILINGELIDLSSYQLRLDAPLSMCIGGSLTLQMDISRITGLVGGLLDEHQNLELLARIEISGFDIFPPNLVFTRLPENETISLRWEMSALTEGIHQGSIWIYLQSENSLEEERTAIYALPLVINVNTVFGFTLGGARFFALISLISGIGLFLAIRVR